MESPKVYIIIVHFNEVNDTVQCIKSLNKQSATFEKIIVVNNTESEINWNSLLDGQMENFVIINSTKNNGYAAACNLGINHIRKVYKTDFYWLLNNDTEVAFDCLEKLLKYSITNKNVGLMGSKILHLNRKNVLQGVAGTYNKFLCTTTHIGKGEQDSGRFTNANLKFDYPLGVSLFVRNEFINDVGLLSEEYFLYFEELDWSNRANNRNWKLGICLESKVYHKGGASTGAMKENRSAKSALSDFHAIRSRIIYSKKYIKAYLPFLYLFLVILSVEMIFRGKIKRVKMIIDLLDNINANYVESRYK